MVRERVLAFCLLLCVVLACCDLRAQDQINKSSMVFFELRHADAEGVVEVVENLQSRLPSATVRCDPRTNTIIVVGTELEIAPIKKLIDKLDVPNDEVQSVVKVFKLMNVPSGRAASTLAQLLNDNSQPVAFRVTADENTNSIIVSGSPGKMDMVETLLTKLDEDHASVKSDRELPENCVVRITWLVDSDSDAFRQPSERLSDLVEGLKKGGVLSKPATLTTVQAAVKIPAVDKKKGTDFVCSSSRKVGGATLALTTTGYLKSAGNGRFDVEIVLQMHGGETTLRIGTSVNLPKDHPIAFSVSELDELRTALVVEVLDVE